MYDVALDKTILLAEEASKEITESSGSDNQSLVILVTGFVVVFMVLLLLIGIIKVYSGIVYAAQNRTKKSKIASEVTVTPEPVTEVVEETSEEGLDLQTVAVITAAVEAFYSKDKKVRIKAIRPAVTERSEWASAGLFENIPAMRSEGLL